MKRFLEYNQKLKERAKILSKNMTAPEKKLRFEFFKKISLTKGVAGSRGIRIYKQRPIDNFIVDFYIPQLKMVVEIDGESHFDEHGKVYDKERTAVLEGLGLTVIRFTNEEVMNNFDGVRETLEMLLKKSNA